jgi:predicted nucleotidyltransferase
MTTATERATIERAGQALIEAVGAPSKVILFGSPAPDDAGGGDDYKFLVIEQEVHDRFGEMARLGVLLGRLLIPAEVVVISAAQAEKAGAVRGSLIHRALGQGRVIAES